MKNILETYNLGKCYGKNNVLNNVNIHIPAHSIYGLIGKNGAGKTTLMRILCNLKQPSTGNYFLYGVKNTEKSIVRYRRKIGAIIELPAVYTNMTAKENLIVQSKLINNKKETNIDELLKITGLNGLDNKKVKNFSLGMRQRLGIAIALIGNPELIILDEPINGLDPQGIIDLRKLIVYLNKNRNITFLISSHYLDELSKIATNFGFIDKGNLIEEISRQKLNEKCKNYIQIDVNNQENCIMYLEQNNIPYEVIDKENINIYKDINVSNLIVDLTKYDCLVNKFQEREENLEDYFMNLIGGEK